MRKFLQPLLIGELAPEEPSQDGPQNVSRALVEAKPLVWGWKNGGIAGNSFMVCQPSRADSCWQSCRDACTSISWGTPGRPSSLLWALHPHL